MRASVQPHLIAYPYPALSTLNPVPYKPHPTRQPPNPLTRNRQANTCHRCTASPTTGATCRGRRGTRTTTGSHRSSPSCSPVSSSASSRISRSLCLCLRAVCETETGTETETDRQTDRQTETGSMAGADKEADARRLTPRPSPSPQHHVNMLVLPALTLNPKT